MNKEGRLNLRINSVLLNRVRKIAKQNGVTVTSLVLSAFTELVAQDDAIRFKKRITGTENPAEAEQI